MKGILILTLAMSVYLFFSGNIKIDGLEVTNPIKRYIVSLIGSFVLSLVIGLPVLGIIYLLR